MNRVGLYISAVLILAVMVVISACASKTTEVPTLKAEVLVKELPEGVEGLELRDGALWLKKGYTFEPQPGGTFRIQNPGGGGGTGGGCGCKSPTGGGCEPKLEGGIIVCKADATCTNCGLAITVGGISTDIIAFRR